MLFPILDTLIHAIPHIGHSYSCNSPYWTFLSNTEFTQPFYRALGLFSCPAHAILLAQPDAFVQCCSRDSIWGNVS